MALSLKWQVEGGKVYSQSGTPRNDCLRGKTVGAHTHTYTLFAHRHRIIFSFCYTFICPSADSRSIGRPDKRRMAVCAPACACVCVCTSRHCVCSLYPSTHLSAEPCGPVRVETRDLVQATDRRNKR